MKQINTTEEREQWALIKDQAQTLIQSKALPSNFTNSAQVMAVIQYGRELGYLPMTALQNISLINGKPTLSANLVGALLKKAGYKYYVTEYSDEKVKICFIEPGSDKEQCFEYTMEEAKKAENASKANYKKYSKEMLYARCLSRGGRIVAPEVLAGVYASEEFNEEPTGKTKKVDVGGETNFVTNPPENKGKEVIDPDEVDIEEGEWTEPVNPTLLERISKVTTKDELNQIYNEYTELQANEEFKEALKKKQSEIKAAASNVKSQLDLILEELQTSVTREQLMTKDAKFKFKNKIETEKKEYKDAFAAMLKKFAKK